MSRPSTLAFLAAAAILAHPLRAQGTAVAVRVSVVSTSDSTPLAGATVRSDTVVRRTDADGSAQLTLPRGPAIVVASRFGFVPETLTVTLQVDTTVVMALESRAELEAMIVGATRIERRIEEQPIRVEVIGREEIEEKLLMTPGDISMMLNETSGLRVQTTSPSLGAASVRVQGLRGRYTQILSDGLPLHGGQTGGLGLLQIPPMDLGRVEVIKGAASALYGSSALGGVVNLVSRRPGPDEERELLLNATSRGGTDAVLWWSRQVSDALGVTMLGGAHGQRRDDVDDDGWADLARYRRVIARPRLFWSDDDGRNGFATIGFTDESRAGGTMPGETAPDGSSFVESLDSRRADAGGALHLPLARAMSLDLRGAAALQRHEHGFGERRERDRHQTLFAEAALRQSLAEGTAQWVGGVAFERDAYVARDVSGFDFTDAVLSAFLHGDVEPARWLSLSASARLDSHDRYGTTLSPRLSALLRPASGGAFAGWTMRPAIAVGVFAPTPFTEETEVVGLGALEGFPSLVRERATTYTLDVGGPLAGLEVNATAFASVVRDPVAAIPSTDGARLRLVNAGEPTRTSGAELLARLDREPFIVTASYAYIRGTELDVETGRRRELSLVPRHAVGVVGAIEDHERGRIGVELYYTGRQALHDDPYRSRSEPYLIVGALAERRIGRARAFINLENIGDTRQTRTDPLVRPARGLGGRWTTDAWTELAGRTINGGIRVEF